MEIYKMNHNGEDILFGNFVVLYYVMVYDINDHFVMDPVFIRKKEADYFVSSLLLDEDKRRSIHRVLVRSTFCFRKYYKWYSIGDNTQADVFNGNSGTPFDSCKVNFYSFYGNLIKSITQKEEIDWQYIRKEMYNMDGHAVRKELANKKRCLYATRLFHIVGTPEDQYVIEDWRLNMAYKP